MIYKHAGSFFIIPPNNSLNIQHLQKEFILCVPHCNLGKIMQFHKGANKDKNNWMITQAANAASGRTGKATPA